MDFGGHIPIQRSDHMVGQLHNGHFQPGLFQVFRHFHTDIAAAYHNGAFGELFFHIVPDLDGVGNVPQGKHPRIVHPVHLGHQGCCAGGQNQLVIAFGVIFTGLDIVHGDLLFLRIDGGDFIPYPHIHIEPAVEALGCLESESRFLVDLTADVIGQAAVGKGDVLSPLEHDDLCLFIQTTQTGRRRSAASHATYNQNFHKKDLLFVLLFCSTVVFIITHRRSKVK